MMKWIKSLDNDRCPCCGKTLEVKVEDSDPHLHVKAERCPNGCYQKVFRNTVQE